MASISFFKTGNKENFEKIPVVSIDKSTGNAINSQYSGIHMMEKSAKQEKIKRISYVPIAISNAKRTLLAIYHKFKAKYQQLHLEGFYYKLHRSYFDNRWRLVVAMADNYF